MCLSHRPLSSSRRARPFFRQMAAAYPQALIAQRNLFQLQDAYVDALISVWQRSVEIRGLLIDGGVELADSNSSAVTMPAKGGDPGFLP